jgi:hypothetical protein
MSVEHLMQDCDEIILAAWNSGQDTYDIALALGIDEHVVANRLPIVLAKRREAAA